MAGHGHATVRDLPLEVQEDIVGLLALKDVVHLEQTCQHFYDLITNSNTIWRRRLARECVDNKLFAPSFDHLTAGAAIRKACTSGPRLHWACLRTPREGDTLLPHSIIGLKIPTLDRPSHNTEAKVREGEAFVHDTLRHPTENATTRVVKDAILIPGGRYLLVAYAHELSMWDISSAPTPKLCFQQDLSGSGTASFPHCLDVWVEDDVVILKVLLEIPSSPVSKKLNTARFFEIPSPSPPFDGEVGRGQAPSPSEATLWVRDIGCVAWMGDYDLLDIKATRERIIFKFPSRHVSSPRVLLFWYPRKNTFATLVPSTSIALESTQPMEMIFAHDYLMLVDGQGVWGFDVALIPSKPVPTYFSIAEYSLQAAVEPSFAPFPDTLFHSGDAEGHNDPAGQLPVVPSPDALSSRAFRTFGFQNLVCDHRHLREDSHMAYRGTLFFNQSDPTKSHMRLSELLAIEVTEHREPQASYPDTRTCDGGRVEGTVWVMPRTPFTKEHDNKAHYMSLSMTRWWAAAKVVAGDIEDEDGMAPFISRSYWREESPSALLTSSFCPASATAVVVWGNGSEQGRTWFDVYRF